MISPHQWQLKAGYAMDFGSEKMLGHNAGMQITISKKRFVDEKKIIIDKIENMKKIIGVLSLAVMMLTLRLM